jgi:hypothetical protein
MKLNPPNGRFFFVKIEKKWKAAQSRIEEGMGMGWKSDSGRL